jgi:hypothetical protein
MPADPGTDDRRDVMISPPVYTRLSMIGLSTPLSSVWTWKTRPSKSTSVLNPVIMIWIKVSGCSGRVKKRFWNPP